MPIYPLFSLTRQIVDIGFKLLHHINLRLMGAHLRLRFQKGLLLHLKIDLQMHTMPHLINFEQKAEGAGIMEVEGQMLISRPGYSSLQNLN